MQQDCVEMSTGKTNGVVEGGKWELQAWLPDGYSQIFRLYVFGPTGLKDYGSATLRCLI